MFKLLSIAVLSIGLATSAMAGGGDAGGAGGGPNGMGTHHAYDGFGGNPANSILAPDQTTTGSINGAGTEAGSSDTGTSTRMKARHCDGSASATTTGAMTSSACK